MMTKFRLVVFPGHGDHKIHMVHVVDVATLIGCVAETGASGFFNAADPDPLSIRQWIEEIAAELGVPHVRKISVPLFAVNCLSWLCGYRLLAREQLLMLKLPHVLSIDESLAIGWRPQFSNARIARDIARHIARTQALRAGISRQKQ
jgi:nucleoside-diphosphate-sugar epimerase